MSSKFFMLPVPERLGGYILVFLLGAYLPDNIDWKDNVISIIELENSLFQRSVIAGI